MVVASSFNSYSRRATILAVRSECASPCQNLHIVLRCINHPPVGTMSKSAPGCGYSSLGPQGVHLGHLPRLPPSSPWSIEKRRSASLASPLRLRSQERMIFVLFNCFTGAQSNMRKISRISLPPKRVHRPGCMCLLITGHSDPSGFEERMS